MQSKVFRQALDDVTDSEGEFVKALADQGRSTWLVQTSDGSEKYVHLPARFQHKVWISNGDILVVKFSEENTHRICGSIERRVTEDQVRDLIVQNRIPLTLVEGFISEKREEIDAFNMANINHTNQQRSKIDASFLLDTDSEDSDSDEE
ncbi:hypothetical protein PCE1_002934 [Barthelona sp. PCE]